MKPDEIRRLTRPQRRELLLQLEDELIYERGKNHRFRGYSDTVHNLRNLKKDIARIKTIMNEPTVRTLAPKPKDASRETSPTPKPAPAKKPVKFYPLIVPERKWYQKRIIKYIILGAIIIMTIIIGGII